MPVHKLAEPVCLSVAGSSGTTTANVTCQLSISAKERTTTPAPYRFFCKKGTTPRAGFLGRPTVMQSPCMANVTRLGGPGKGRGNIRDARKQKTCERFGGMPGDAPKPHARIPVQPPGAGNPVPVALRPPRAPRGIGKKTPAEALGGRIRVHAEWKAAMRHGALCCA